MCKQLSFAEMEPDTVLKDSDLLNNIFTTLTTSMIAEINPIRQAHFAYALKLIGRIHGELLQDGVSVLEAGKLFNNG